MEVVIEIRRTSFIDGRSVYMEKERGVKRVKALDAPLQGKDADYNALKFTLWSVIIFCI